MAGRKRDVLIVGAGFAGAAAAHALSQRGLDVLVLEARGRIGGRAHARPFAGDGEILEFGGAWITPWQHRIRSLAAEHGLALRPRHPVRERRWYRDGALHRDGPTTAAERGAHERAIARVAADAMLAKRGHDRDEKGRPIAGLSFADYLDRLQPPQATRELFSAWWCMSGSGDWTRVPASEFLASCAYGEGTPDGMIDVWVETVSPSMAALAERMLAGADLVLDAAVAEVAQDAAGVAAHTRDGRSFAAATCILAAGINQLSGVAFRPALPPAKAEAIARGHEGRAFKLWVKARGTAPGILVTGGGSGIEFMFSERESGDGAAMIVGFGLANGRFDPSNRAQVAAGLARFFPEAEILAHDWHDWVADPFARGTWVAAPLGAEAGLDSDNWAPEGRLAFATSDVAPEQAGWFEAAVISGEQAAEAVARLLGRN